MRELEDALALAGDHLSLYQLTIEPGTGFEAMVKRGAIVMPDEDTARTLFDATQDRLLAASMPAYEISNHASPGAESRHNLIYWEGGYYLGIGPGAHGRLPHPDGRSVQASAQIKKPERWIKAVNTRNWGGDTLEIIDPATRATERVMMGMRLTKGLDIAAVNDQLGLSPERYLNQDGIDHLLDLGLLQNQGGRLIVTQAGRPLLNSVIDKILL